MQARDLMTRSVVTVQPRTPLAQAISLLVGNGFAALPVVDEDGHVIGMLSESNALIAGRDQAGTTVEQVMTASAHVLSPSADMSTIAVRMINFRLRSMPVGRRGILI